MTAACVRREISFAKSRAVKIARRRMPPADKKPLGCSLIKNGTTGALGFARPSLLAAAVAVLELVFALYGLVKYARLTHRDLIGAH